MVVYSVTTFFLKGFEVSFYLDVRLPVGIQIKAEYREQFSGTIRTLLGFVLEDLEERTVKNYQYFLKERLSDKERKVLIGLLRETQKEHSNLEVSMESHQEPPLIDLNPVIRRYTRCPE